MIRWLSNLRERGLGTRSATLLAAMAAAGLLAAPVAWHVEGRNGLAAALTAGLACLTGSGFALVAGEPFRAAGRVLPGMLLGMIFRMGVPLATAVVFYGQSGGLASPGFPCYLVFFFEIGLLIEVFLSLPVAARRPRRAEGSDNMVSSTE